MNLEKKYGAACGAGEGFETERINLFGIPTELVIQSDIMEYDHMQHQKNFAFLGKCIDRDEPLLGCHPKVSAAIKKS